MPFEVTILQDNKVLPVNVVAMLEQRGFQQEQDADAFYITKTYGSSTDAVKEVLELAPNIQLVQHLHSAKKVFAVLPTFPPPHDGYVFSNLAKDRWVVGCHQ